LARSETGHSLEALFGNNSIVLAYSPHFS
jgi:hypothetical protein